MQLSACMFISANGCQTMQHRCWNPCPQLVCTYLSICPMHVCSKSVNPGLCMHTSSPRSLSVHVTHRSAVCSPQRGSGGRAEECSPRAILGHTGCSGSATAAARGCALASFTCADCGCGACVCVFFPSVCVHVPPLCRCTHLSIAHFRTTTSCLRLQMNGTTSGERANLLSREFGYKWATPGKRLSLFDIVWPLKASVNKPLPGVGTIWETHPASQSKQNTQSA